jgi:coenzyme PQQ precursor peptide PqqA
VSAEPGRADDRNAAGGSHPPDHRRNEEQHMKWETPVAIDLRFGMEITMYVANR